MNNFKASDSTVVRTVTDWNTGDNNYYSKAELINVDEIIKDCYITKYVAEDFLEEGNAEDLNFVIVEAFDKTFVSLMHCGDKPRIVFKDKDGEVHCQSDSQVSIELSGQCYYTSDETTILGQEEPFEDLSSWLWDSICIDPPVKILGISEKTFTKFLEVRKEDIDELRGESND